MMTTTAAAARKDCVKGQECKQAGVAHCEGCLQTFCIRHFNDHRRSLDAELSDLSSDYNDFKTTLDLEAANPFVEIRLQEINKWEMESILTIQKKANDLRETLSHMKDVHIESLSTKFQSLVRQIEDSKGKDDFVEMDIQRWRKRLNDLKSNLISPTTIILAQHLSTPLVASMSVDFLWTGNELFDRVYSNDIRVEEEGEIVRALSFFMVANEIRGKNNYAFGCHKIRLRIEHLSKQWTFLGINSARIPLQKNSYEAKSAYGWCSSNYNYVKGKALPKMSGPAVEMEANDSITLIFDCDNRQISMINERTQVRHDLTINPCYCPFPWQLHVALRNRQSCIRLLST
ncbi:unnamed protein product [Adineta ricciae]|uniref:Uncharacterized protein n=1 Tax=Adineta ricciae TaxID=249248 RepID=A0A816DQZ3_ADIRI|nr:unnamed protein product [Adineta ricciae]